MAKSKNTKIVHRDSETGQFTTEKYSKNHPKTTEKERIKVNPPSKK